LPHVPKIDTISELVGKGGAFVISLPWRQHNYKRTVRGLLSIGVTAEIATYIPAVDGLSAGVDAMGKHLEITTTKGFGVLKIGLGQAGLIATSISLWRRIVKEGRKWSLVLEDDVAFGDDPQIFPEVFKDAWAHISEAQLTPTVVYLGWCQTYSGPLVFLESKSTAHTCYKVKSFEGHPECTHAYLVSLEAAKYWLKHFAGRRVLAALDMELTNLKLKGDVLALAYPHNSGLITQLSVGVDNPSDIAVASSDHAGGNCDGTEVKARGLVEQAGVRFSIACDHHPAAESTLYPEDPSSSCSKSVESPSNLFTFAGVQHSGDASTIAAAAPEELQQCLASLGLVVKNDHRQPAQQQVEGASVQAWLAEAEATLDSEVGRGKHVHCDTSAVTAISVIKSVSELHCGYDLLVFATGIRLNGTADVTHAATTLTAQISIVVSSTSPSTSSSSSGTHSEKDMDQKEVREKVKGAKEEESKEVKEEEVNEEVKEVEVEAARALTVEEIMEQDKKEARLRAEKDRAREVHTAMITSKYGGNVMNVTEWFEELGNNLIQFCAGQMVCIIVCVLVV
jgi:hypothetical protein